MKKYFLLGVLAFMALPLGIRPARAQGGDEAAIRGVFSDFAEAWGRDDTKAMASHWTEDGDLINPQGRVAKGRAEVEKLFGDEHSTMFKGTHITFGAGDIRFVKPDVAVFTTDYTVPGAHAPDGSEMTAKGVVTSVMVKRNGKWMTVSCRPMVPLEQPSGK